ncbi:PREDICTED: probable pectinesterase/pectinesterase inhibitor 17 [Camelina sativa]|uniref:Probable pectinesterase/pectinesterase inhibitor 17 n=1 Tax=Camelina sativa TaxID=90675 RepID=A0ABM0VYV3_CAMSA|nr:PREDICTED: probable pectinesterase/pectinesterase inhibitor 17 [Camelina sativa]
MNYLKDRLKGKLSVSQKIFATVTVSKDGKGNFSRISDAIAVAPENNNGDIRYFQISIKEGVYAEYLIIPSNKGRHFQNCNIFVRRTPTGTNTVTAQNKSNPNQTSGIIIHNSRVTAATDLLLVLGSTQTYLGRPWDKYSTTVFMKTYLDSLIDPRGWFEWNQTTDVSTLFYAEFQNKGPGVSTSGRVTWPGFWILHSASEASRFIVGTFLAGNSWIPPGVPFTSGL